MSFRACTRKAGERVTSGALLASFGLTHPSAPKGDDSAYFASDVDDDVPNDWPIKFCSLQFKETRQSEAELEEEART